MTVVLPKPSPPPKRHLVRYLLLGAALAVVAGAVVFGLWLHRVIEWDREWATVIDLKAVASTCEQFAGNSGGYPVQEKLGPLDGIRGDLVPQYSEYGLPTGRWKSPYLYLSRGSKEVHPEGAPARTVAEHYLVIATGSDRRLDPETLRLLETGPAGQAPIWSLSLRETERFEDDLILVDGAFVQLPEHGAAKLGLEGPAPAAR